MFNLNQKEKKTGLIDLLDELKKEDKVKKKIAEQLHKNIGQSQQFSEIQSQFVISTFMHNASYRSNY